MPTRIVADGPNIAQNGAPPRSFADAPSMTTIRHFRQIVLWPLQLMPLKPGVPVQRHWEALQEPGAGNPWREVRDEFDGDSREFHERHYKEFVTFLPYVQRFLYGSSAGQEAASRASEAKHARVSARRRRARARHVRRRCDAARSTSTQVALYFFLDADVAILAVEISANDIPLDRAQDTVFRFGRAYPASGGRSTGEGGNCPRRVEWLDAAGTVLAASDYEQKPKYLSHVAELPHAVPRFALGVPAEAARRSSTRGRAAALRYRQLEYYRMPFMIYLALDDPTELTRADFVRLGLVTRPGRARHAAVFGALARATSSASTATTASGVATASASPATRADLHRARCSPSSGRHGDIFFAGRETGLLGQFRHQYFLLFLIAHFHKAALLSMSDELAVAMNRLDVGDTESVRQFKRTIRQSMEVFLRFTHRYWFHEVSNQELARSIFAA